MTFTEQAAARKIEEAIAKVFDAEQLCKEAGCTGDAVMRSLNNAGAELVAALNAVRGK